MLAIYGRNANANGSGALVILKHVILLFLKSARSNTIGEKQFVVIGGTFLNFLHAIPTWVDVYIRLHVEKISSHMC